jgi:hypothetical protein
VSLLSRNGTCESPLAIDSTTLFSAMFPWFIFAVCQIIRKRNKLTLSYNYIAASSHFWRTREKVGLLKDIAGLYLECFMTSKNNYR